MDNKKTMEKAGNKKANFVKAMKEIEDYMTDPTVSFSRFLFSYIWF